MIGTVSRKRPAASNQPFSSFMTEPVFRFAPSPNGHLHLGHALSALLNARAAVALHGRFLVRVEDIDQTRCTPGLERDMFEDLAWLGVPLDEPVLRQSEAFPYYRSALEKLQDLGLVYPAYLTRAEIKTLRRGSRRKGQPLAPGSGWHAALSRRRCGSERSGKARTVSERCALCPPA